jgi:hypothetical protein
MTKDQTLAALKNQMDSFYSLQQVIAIIEGIDPDPAGISNESIEQAIDNIIERLECSDRHLVDIESAQFNLSYDNTIELEQVDLNMDVIRKEIEGAFDFLSNQ